MLPSLPSCLKDDKQYFDASPAERLDRTVAKTKEILEAQKGGWIMHYYAGRNYSGIAQTLLFKFEHGNVTIMGDNKDAKHSETTIYDVAKDQGPILTFPTYNSVIHDLASSSLGVPEGIQGDYEFAILELSADRVRLRGKKWKNEMVLTPLQGSTMTDYLKAIEAIRNEMTSNTYNFIMGADTLAQGEVNVYSRHLTVTIDKVDYDVAYAMTNTGMELQAPLKIGGKEYSVFTWNAETKTFSSGDLSVKLYVPTNFKPIEFWEGTWTMRHGRLPGQKAATTLRLKKTSTDNVLEGFLTFFGVEYKIPIIEYNPTTGQIRLQGQEFVDPKGRYPGGLFLAPYSEENNNRLLKEDHNIVFTWDEESNLASAEGSEQEDGQVDSFLGVGLDGGRRVILDKHGNPTGPIKLPSIKFLIKQ